MNKYDGIVKQGKLFISVFNIILLWGIFFVLSCCLYTKYTWGTVSLPQLLFFVQSGLSEGVELKLLIEVSCWCIILPIAITVSYTHLTLPTMAVV